MCWGDVSIPVECSSVGNATSTVLPSRMKLLPGADPGPSGSSGGIAVVLGEQGREVEPPHTFDDRPRKSVGLRLLVGHARERRRVEDNSGEAEQPDGPQGHGDDGVDDRQACPGTLPLAHASARRAMNLLGVTHG